MHLPSALLALPLLIANLLAAEMPPGPPEASGAPPPTSGVVSDPELALVRSQLESAGMRVVEFFRTPEDGRIIAGKVRFAGSRDPRLRAEDVMVFVEGPRGSGCRPVRVCLLAWERPDAADRADEARERLERAKHRARFLHIRPWEPQSGDDEEEGEEEGRKHLLVAFQHLPPADLRPFATFVDDLAVELSAVLGIEAGDGPFLLCPGERERFPVDSARRHLAERVRARSLRGLSAVPPAPGAPASEDPLSLASHSLDANLILPLEHSELARELLDDLGGEPLSVVPGRVALRLGLRVLPDERSAVDVAELRALAYDPQTGQPRNAWALYHWARYLMWTLPDDDQAPRVIEALDALRHSSRLGCEVAMGYYLHLLSIPNEPLVNGESHWEGRARWDALWRNFSPHFIPESIEVELAYRSGDLSPVPVGVDAEGEELRQVRLAVDEMNAARKARGWKLIQVIEERPASEPIAEDAPKKQDPAGAGSSRGS